jgi:hypothetical protein
MEPERDPRTGLLLDQDKIDYILTNTNPDAHNPEMLGRDWRSALVPMPDNHGRNWRVTLGCG